MSSYSFNAANRPPAHRCPGFITDLILRCAALDTAALGTLFDLLYPVVLATVGGGAPSDSAEARVLATFHRLWDLAPTYDPKLIGSVEWVLGQARFVRAASLTDVSVGPAVLT
ncbi:MAG: hypothetical protein JWQ74_1090 [Marmoricola sp.]|nr:hypothetical protein [Marmoricola sp.]